MSARSNPPRKRNRTAALRQGQQTRISLKDIADVVGVSRMTVSLALHNHPSISEETRRRIREQAAQMGYKPDPELTRVMDQIRSKRHSSFPPHIAYITAHPNRNQWRDHPTHFSYHNGAAQRADECGYRLEDFWLAEPGMTARRLGSVIRNRGITGVIISPFPYTKKLFSGFPWEYFSAVALGYSMVRPNLCRTCNHQFQSIQLLVSELHQRGYRRIGFAMERDQNDRVRHNWRGGFMSDVEFFNTWPDVPFLLHEEWTKERFARWLEMQKPDVIVTAGPEVQHWLDELGLRTPEDIGLANVDLTNPMEGLTTGIDQNSLQVGAASIDQLITLMNFNERGIPPIARIVMVEGRFVQGKTTWENAKTRTRS